MHHALRRSLLAIVAVGALAVPSAASAGIPDAALNDSGAATIWPGCLGGSTSFSDSVKYHDGGLFLGGDEIEWFTAREVGPQWNCSPTWPAWVWSSVTISHSLKWTSLQGTLSKVELKAKGSGVTVTLGNGLLTARWSDTVTNADWVFGPRRSWASQRKIHADYGSAIRMRAEHRATATFRGPGVDPVTMPIGLEAHKEQWG